MNNFRFETFTKTLATSTTRRQTLKAIAATALGGLLATAGLESAFAKSCLGNPCSTDKECCPGTVCSGSKKQVGKCVCAKGFTRCGKDCVDLNSDSENCGKCGHKCPKGALCKDGKCVCPQGQVVCGDTCVNLKNDSMHCGDCKTRCHQGEVCREGKCVKASAR